MCISVCMYLFIYKYFNPKGTSASMESSRSNLTTVEMKNKYFQIHKKIIYHFQEGSRTQLEKRKNKMVLN